MMNLVHELQDKKVVVLTNTFMTGVIVDVDGGVDIMMIIFERKLGALQLS